MNDEIRKRHAELVAMQNAVMATWQSVVPGLVKRREQFVLELINADCEEKRGRIKELDFLIRLPEAINDEIILLGRGLPEADPL